jgi:LysR family glycine cleavage system transcriptional activator
MAERLPPMQALRAFETAARMGSLSRAAEALNLTHGAISHQIKALEREFGVRLIERAGRGVRLTDEGARFATRLRAALSEIAEAVREITERSNPRQWRVSVMPSFAARWLLPRIGRFIAANPDIDLDVRANAALADLRRDDIDAAIRYGQGNYAGVESEFLMDDIYFPVCSPRINGGRLPATPADLARYVLLRSENEFWQPWFAAAGLDWPEPTRGPIFNDSSHVMQAAVEGQGVALARSSLIANDLVNGVLVQPFGITAPSPWRYYLVYPPRHIHSLKLAAFRRWLLDEIALDRAARRRADRLRAPRKPKPASVRARKKSA